jgi:fructose 5-dehydrogenase small subunit
MSDPLPMGPEVTDTASGVRRRALMVATAVAGASVLAPEMLAPSRAAGRAAARALNPDEAQFLAVSRAVTGHQDLNPEIATRLFAAMVRTFPDYGARIAALSHLTQAGGKPEEILARAEEANQRQAMLGLVAAWYTGSVRDRTNAPMVAYYDALMYRPTSDALPVPTYCFGTPAWWTETPPPLGVSVASPVPVAAPAPPPVGVASKPPPQSRILPTKPPAKEH